MTRWSTILPAASASELLELAEILRKAATLALARVQATEGFQSASTLTGPDAKVAICMVGAVAVCAVSYLVSKRCAKTPNVKEVLAMNPDLFAFSSFYDRILSKPGPFDVPDLATTQSRFVILAPTNDAFTRDQKRLSLLDEGQWRFLLLSHVICTDVQPDRLSSLASLPSVTRSMAPLNCLVDKFSDGSNRVRVPQEASNGLVYAIDALIEPGEQCEQE
uniref:FAS1 domain-containing protein n=1 Tax=Hemiselmis andersenii TaxID=464988 RepID=A0A6U2G1Z1_HEMAN|mmetsp:Transcript_34924/g.81842  ORF Transcript_34924/g.81842 Transcript_34924/m.81842 type:complete len:220 (+) Transcript_34924:75-734(+)|eukprot:CAMPEP_0114150714 /NCGR_PEP_ID=MMETSP0043_2-20121206/22863_1 /TAXON_ID=464988 /ORGANISM="Hemiselmis andersenii, Strain CCMP644" /LENGTH=219 /DNA_ID=CAMNT_0001245489 /DNA_START=53 /DNA_END=712 /DNA_ORIENTATION=+